MLAQTRTMFHYGIQVLVVRTQNLLNLQYSCLWDPNQVGLTLKTRLKIKGKTYLVTETVPSSWDLDQNECSIA